MNINGEDGVCSAVFKETLCKKKWGLFLFIFVSLYMRDENRPKYFFFNVCFLL